MPYTPAVPSLTGDGGSGVLGVAVTVVTLLPCACDWCYKECTPTDTHQPGVYQRGARGWHAMRDGGNTCSPVGSGAVDEQFWALICEDEDWLTASSTRSSANPRNPPEHRRRG